MHAWWVPGRGRGPLAGRRSDPVLQVLVATRNLIAIASHLMTPTMQIEPFTF